MRIIKIPVIDILCTSDATFNKHNREQEAGLDSNIQVQDRQSQLQSKLDRPNKFVILSCDVAI